MTKPINIFWFRRDLRLQDNAGLSAALQSGLPVLLLFIFDSNILDKLENKTDRRVEFIYRCLEDMQETVAGFGSAIEIRKGTPINIFKELIIDFQIKYVFTNEDYEPYARERDEEIGQYLKSQDIGFRSSRDQVIFSKSDVLKPDGTPYTVYTPYSRKWKSVLNESKSESLKDYPVKKYLKNLYPRKSRPILNPEQLGFIFTGEKFPSYKIDQELIKQYEKQRDYPSLDATSHLGIHLRFGTISIRHLTETALKESEVYLNELIWREFYQMILWFFPQVGKGKAFKPTYENIRWINNEKEFECWCEGRTGYPMVDAGMRQLNETGFMHNRLRMITASFLTKHLLIDWRWGEAYFAEKLLDYDLANNNGGWQWSAGCGCDAAPYFRIFNPYAQQKKFDPEGTYISRWLPDLGNSDYPEPIVDHEFARARVIETYKKALSGQ